MARRSWVWREGKLVEITPEAAKPLVHAVHQDTLKGALRHPVTGEVTDSTSRYMKINDELGLEVVGNDLLSKRPAKPADTRFSEDMVLDKIQKAEAIASDPTRLREYRNMNEQLRERNERLLKNGSGR